MRTVYRGFFVPMLIAVVVGAFLTSGMSAWWSSVAADQRERERIESVVSALQNRGFPLTPAVLGRMSLLSGVQFAMLDNRGELQAATLPGLREAYDRHSLPATDTLLAPSDSLMWHVGDADYRVHMALLGSTSPTDPERLLVLVPREQWWARNAAWLLPTVVLGLANCVALALTVTLCARRVVRPLRQLGTLTEPISIGNFESIHIPCDLREIHELAEAVNLMLTKLRQYESTVRQSERFKTLGQLSGSMAHQLRNAATGARIALDLHRRGAAGECDLESLTVADQQLTNIEHFLRRFLALGSVRPGNTTASGPVAIADVVQSVCTYVDVLARHNQVSLEVACDVDQRIAGPSDDVEQTLICLLVNAIEAARYDRDRSPRVRVEVVSLPDQTIRLAVYDSGKGPSSDIAPRLFEPFVTDKPTGTGIGLALAKELMAARGGQLTWRREAEWTCFEITLPIVASHEVKHALAGCG